MLCQLCSGGRPGALTSLTAAHQTLMPARIPSTLTFLTWVYGFLLGHLLFYVGCLLFVLCGSSRLVGDRIGGLWRVPQLPHLPDRMTPKVGSGWSPMTPARLGVGGSPG